MLNNLFDLKETHEQLMQPKRLGIKVTSPLRVGEELQVCYGEKYEHRET